MTNLEYLGQALEVTLGLILIFKLLSLRLHNVYRLFCCFLALELLGSILWMLQHLLTLKYPAQPVDYRLSYAIQRFAVCALIVFTVYALLEAVLRSFPGILRLSRTILNCIFGAAACVGASSAAWEYRHSGYGSYTTWQDMVLFAAIMTDRLVSSVVLLVIVGTLIYVLWFPVQIARNLAVFIVGFAVYSVGLSISLLVQSLVVHETSRWISTLNEFLMGGCFAYWGIFITPEGEKSAARLNSTRDPAEQARLIHSLELLNESLMRGTDR